MTTPADADYSLATLRERFAASPVAEAFGGTPADRLPVRVDVPPRATVVPPADTSTDADAPRDCTHLYAVAVVASAESLVRDVCAWAQRGFGRQSSDIVSDDLGFLGDVLAHAGTLLVQREHIVIFVRPHERGYRVYTSLRK